MNYIIIKYTQVYDQHPVGSDANHPLTSRVEPYTIPTSDTIPYRNIMYENDFITTI